MADAAEMSAGLEKLLREASDGQIATLMPDGSPHVTQVWLDTDGTHILINTVSTHQKARNARRDPRVAINVQEPGKPYRIANIRGTVVDITSEGAAEHIDALALKYLGQPKYPYASPGQQRLILKIRPERINSIGLDGPAWKPPA
jgi:PPOX class probable F420-dependent enzyme